MLVETLLVAEVLGAEVLAQLEIIMADWERQILAGEVAVLETILLLQLLATAALAS